MDNQKYSFLSEESAHTNLVYTTALSAFLFWFYGLYGAPITTSNIVAIQNIVFFLSVILLCLPIAYVLLGRIRFRINRYYIYLSMFYILSILSISWSSEPSFSLNVLKFHIYPFVIGFVGYLVTDRETVHIWIQLVLFTSFIVMIHASVFILNSGNIRTYEYGVSLNIVVLALLTSVPLLMYKYIYSNQKIRIVYLGSILLSLVILLVSGSRSAIVVLICWTLLGCYFYRTWIVNRIGFKLITIPVLLVVTFSGIILKQTSFDRIYSQTVTEILSLSGPIMNSDPIRIKIYKFSVSQALQLDTIIRGMGYHMFAVEFESVTGHSLFPPHNIFLKSLLELGVFGLLLLLLGQLYVARTFFYKIKNTNNDWTKILTFSAFLSYFGIIVFGSFQPIYGSIQLYILPVIIFVISEGGGKQDG